MCCGKGQAKGHTYGRTALAMPKDDVAIRELPGEKVVACGISNSVDY